MKFKKGDLIEPRPGWPTQGPGTLYTSDGSTQRFNGGSVLVIEPDPIHQDQPVFSDVYIMNVGWIKVLVLGKTWFVPSNEWRCIT